MSMADLSAAQSLIEANPALASFAGPRPEPLVALAERALELRLPPTYRSFVLRYGAGSFGAFEVYGVIDDDFEIAAAPDAVACTLSERAEHGLPGDLIVVGDSGGDELLCLLVRDECGEAPVIAVRTGPEGELLEDAEVLAQDFGQFLLDAVRQELGGGGR
ncbi:SMI1/KNR4 family protein [Sorangium sp. So ce291]|uniref:SMI1/KNR4 family protein n=1 Tax=Sorangium sp. So ce291 TaxID=3133294 RepID=UPI003F62C32B